MIRTNWARILKKVQANEGTIDIYTLESCFRDANILKIQHGIVTIRYEFYEDDRLAGARKAYIPLAEITVVEEELSYVPSYLGSLEEIPTAEKDLE